jgi:hypothetical protein
MDGSTYVTMLDTHGNPPPSKKQMYQHQNPMREWLSKLNQG